MSVGWFRKSPVYLLALEYTKEKLRERCSYLILFKKDKQVHSDFAKPLTLIKIRKCVKHYILIQQWLIRMWSV